MVRWEMRPGKGRGVVAAKDIPAGTEVERSPVIIVPDADLLDRGSDLTVLDQYLLYWDDDEGREHAMGGGLLMFYNHSSHPNIELEDGPEPDTMSVITLRVVVAGEELCYDYDIALWFTPAQSHESDTCRG
ncbi:MAG: SET domain-containing protein-lysine N-methyltransferase [Gemmatimonadota bacterium]|nr:SET domain-containing protein-lysine N-methyltransferase [Gemmatimonadota bacterium]